MAGKKKCGCKKTKQPKIIGLYGGGGLYYNCIYHRGSGKCTHPMRSDPRRNGPQGCMCRYTSKTEQKCPDYFGSNPYYSHEKGGKK